MIYLLVFFKLLLILVQNHKGGAKPRQNEPNYTRLLLLIKYARKYRRDKIGTSLINDIINKTNNNINQ